jgi:tRNA A37 methylthiotransferase MiaB
MKIYLTSAEFNCHGNILFNARLADYFRLNRHELVSMAEKADYVIVNTCAVDAWHEEYSKKLLKKYAQITGKKVIAVGCMSRLGIGVNGNRNNIIVIDDYAKLNSLFATRFDFNNKDSVCMTSKERKHFDGEKKFSRFDLFWKIIIWCMGSWLKISKGLGFASRRFERLLHLITMKNKLIVEIGSGCQGNCSYCVIRKVRGPIYSMPRESILRQVEGKTVKNIYLVSDDTGNYGIDRGTNLIELLHEIFLKNPEVSIELNYLNPWWLLAQPEEYLKLFGSKRIVSINVPVQSGSDRILKKMKRPYAIDDLSSYLRRCRRAAPGMIIITQIMVGFPGETLVDYLRTIRALTLFDFAHVIPYSDRPGTESQNFFPKNSTALKHLKLLCLSLIMIATCCLRNVRLTRKDEF